MEIKFYNSSVLFFICAYLRVSAAKNYLATITSAGRSTRSFRV